MKCDTCKKPVKSTYKYYYLIQNVNKYYVLNSAVDIKLLFNINHIYKESIDIKICKKCYSTIENYYEFLTAPKYIHRKQVKQYIILKIKKNKCKFHKIIIQKIKKTAKMAKKLDKLCHNDKKT